MYITEELCNKLEYVIDYETTKKERIINNINEIIDNINNDGENPHKNLTLVEEENGYYLHCEYMNVRISKFAFTLSEIIIHLRYMR